MARSRTLRSRLDELRDEASTCTRCPLHLLGTQTVFGEGPPDASVVLVGEQPGDKEDLGEIAACRTWLDRELSVVEPKVVVCLGATAAQSLISKGLKVTKQRGEMLPWPPDALITATVHPSSILRSPDDASRASAFDGLVRDLRKVAAHL